MSKVPHLEDDACPCPSRLFWANPYLIPKPGQNRSQGEEYALQRAEPAGMVEGLLRSWGALHLKGSSQGTLAQRCLCPDFPASLLRSPIAWETC